MLGGVLALAAVAALAGVAARAGDDDALQPDAPFAADGTIAGAFDAQEKTLPVTLSKNTLATLDLSGAAKVPLRVDKAQKRGNDLAALFPKEAKIAGLGRRWLNDPRRIAPYFAIVVGDGFAPKEANAVARDRFGEKVVWFSGQVARTDAPDTLTTNFGVLKVGRDDRVLSCAVRPSATEPAALALLAKGAALRFRGKIATVLYKDAKGKLVESADRKKPGVRAEVRVIPARLILLDPGFDYAPIETASEGS